MSRKKLIEQVAKQYVESVGEDLLLRWNGTEQEHIEEVLYMHAYPFICWHAANYINEVMMPDIRAEQDDPEERRNPMAYYGLTESMFS